mgnify:CR=1 FL=1
MKSRRKSDFLSSRVQYISLAQLSPNPQQPRRSFDEDSLSELAESIRRYGILQPLTVRRQGTGYELVAGERRLRAAAMAGLREVPCLVAQVGEEDSALLALMEGKAYICGLDEYRTGKVRSISVSNVRFPWNRTFEMTFALNPVLY